MFETTQAILLHCQKYSDKAVILHTYTQNNGRMNFMVYGQLKKGLKGILATPLTIVEISYDNKPGQEMHVLHSLSPVYLSEPNPDLLFIRMFISEVIYKTLRQPMADERVYQFLVDYIQKEAPSDSTSDLQAFMTQFSVLLGYGGEWLDEWKELKSVEMIQEMMD